jgi:hypothetical protein
VAGSDTSPSTVSTAGSPAGLIVRDVATTAQPVRGDEAGADALRTSRDDNDLVGLFAHDLSRR